MTRREMVLLVLLVLVLVGLFVMLFAGCPGGVCRWL